MRPSPARLPTSLTFILDFDGTVTAKDTISALFSAALDFHVQHGKGKEMGDALKEILSGYVADLDAHEKLRPEGKRGGFRTVEEVVGYQRGLRPVETRSFERVSRSGILGGVDEERWTRMARRAVDVGGKDGVIIREGFQSFARKLKDSGWAWRVVSVNFSESWIRGILNTQGVDDVEILANQPDDMGRLSGPMGDNGKRGDLVVTSDGKLAAMHEGLKGATGGSPKVIYIGDSLTDIECLLQPGVIGIVMVGEDGTSKLLETLRHVSSGEGYEYLKDIRDVKDFKDDEGKALYFARDFKDIRDSPLLDR